MIDEHEKFQLFSIDTLPTMFILRAHFACHKSLYRGQRTLSHVRFISDFAFFVFERT